MRAQRALIAAGALLFFVSVILVGRQSRFRDAIDSSTNGVLNKFRGGPQLELQDGATVFEHHPGGDGSVSRRVGKVTMLIGDPNPTYERAVKTHLLHGKMQGHETFVMRSRVLDTLYNKPLAVLHLLMDEMNKPYHERLEWILWFDADSVLMNPALSLSHFLPPAEFPNVNILLTDDLNGLNNGVFLIKVCGWSIELLVSVISHRFFRPDVSLLYQDQTAMEKALEFDHFRGEVAKVPQRWFNAYKSGHLSEAIGPEQARRGDLLVHFAGVPQRADRINEWCDIAEQHQPAWELEFEHTSYPDEISQFWKDKKAKDDTENKELAKLKDAARSLIERAEHGLDVHRDKLDADEVQRIESAIAAVKEKLEVNFKDQLQGPVDELTNAIDKFDNVEEALTEQINDVARKTIIVAEKMGLDADSLREIMIGPTDSDQVKEATKQLQDKIDAQSASPSPAAPATQSTNTGNADGSKNAENS